MLGTVMLAAIPVLPDATTALASMVRTAGAGELADRLERRPRRPAPTTSANSAEGLASGVLAMHVDYRLTGG